MRFGREASATATPEQGRRVRPAAGLVVAVAVFLLAAAPASAAISHVFTGTFGSEASSPKDEYPLSEPTDVAIDESGGPSNGDIYVTDPGNHRIEKFNSEGDFLLMFGLDVNKHGTTEAEQDVCRAGEECQPGTPGPETGFCHTAMEPPPCEPVTDIKPGQLNTPAFLAVDDSPEGEGDLYVGDTGTHLVEKFDPSGHIVSSWGNSGQKDGSDSQTINHIGLFGPLYGLAVAPNGTLYVGGLHYNDNVWFYTRIGVPLPGYTVLGGSPGLEVESAGELYGNDGSGLERRPADAANASDEVEQVTQSFGSVTGFALDSADGEIYLDSGSVIAHYSSDCPDPVLGPCSSLDAFGTGNLSAAAGVAVNGATHAVYVANTGENDVAVFSDVRPQVTTEPPAQVGETTLTLAGHIDPTTNGVDHGEITECFFEWGLTKAYGHTAQCEPPTPYAGEKEVTAKLEGLTPITELPRGTRYHYRIVATSAEGATRFSADQTARTTAPAEIEGVSASHITATSVQLEATVAPNGLPTKYHFEYGATSNYGQTIPEPEITGTSVELFESRTVTADIENLQRHVTYHFRLVAENELNESSPATSEDHTFEFFPPSCPNSAVRQQTGAAYLPDCRAYELVTPGDAGGTQIYPDGPNTGYATSPSRLSYTGAFSAVPGSGGSPIDSVGDLYVATRTDTGWVSRYVGLPSSQAAVDGGPPLGPPDSTAVMEADGGSGPRVQNGVLTDPQMDIFADFNDGNQGIGSGNTNDFQNKTVISSNAPYVWSADGSALDRWPTNLGTVPDGSYNGLPLYPPGINVELTAPPLSTAPGGAHALDCPYDGPDLGYTFIALIPDYCPGDVTASSDLSHFVFATEWNVFAPGGQLGAPGSVYDNNTQAATVAVASKTPAGGNIPSEATDGAGDPLQIPAVSSDGSHILIAAAGTGPCGFSTCPEPPCGAPGVRVLRCPLQPSHLYMRVDDAITYDVSQGHDVSYVGESSDGSKVYFTSEEHLTHEDEEHGGASLYMWSQKGEEEDPPHPLTLISRGESEVPGTPGNTAACSADFTTKCGITTYSQSQMSYCQLGSTFGGNCLSDNFISSENGDIYFSSPEQLDGSRGIPNQQNLYVYRGGQVQFVTTLSGAPYCYEPAGEGSKTCTRIERMEVSPNDSHMAFITSSQITQYNNAGHLEMYTYEPSTRRINCVSCIPSGAPPTSNVLASQDGLFMTNDGRAFFSTEDALVSGDTNHSEDVYEYVGGHPQLITPGTGDTSQPGSDIYESAGGLIGVSADGTDVYFGTYQTLVPADHNGLFFKIYDARSGGGFSAPAPPPPCDAADECHGAGSSPPAALQDGAGASLTGGNATPESHPKHHKKKNKRKNKRHHKRIAHHNRGGSK